jgi:LysM repeat protein
VSAGGLRAACKVSGKMASLPEQPGVLVFIGAKHVGVYVGGGFVVEAKGSDDGVVKTPIKGRGWDGWGLCPWVEYGASGLDTQGIADPKSEAACPPQAYTVKPGDSFCKISMNVYGSERHAAALAWFNGLTLHSVIHPGQALKIPKKGA